MSSGGAALILSAFLPWVTTLGYISVHLSGSGVLFTLGLGAALAYLGVRLLENRVSKATRVTLWILTPLDALLVFGLLAALNSNSSGGLVQPAIGFDLAVIGLIASIIGTVLMPTVKTA